MDELIPERLVEHKRVGLLNVPNADEATKIFRALGVVCEQYDITDPSLAEYYKFLSENELVIYDSEQIDQGEIRKISAMFGSKLVDIKNLPAAEYPFIGKTFGVVGLGRIGKKVARIAKDIGFEVIYYSQTRKMELEKQIGINYASLEELAEKSDVVSIHLPAHKAENLFDDNLIAKLKKGAFFINTADGNSIDQTALTKRMLNGEVFAFLDVYPGLPRKDVLGMTLADKKDWKIRQELPNHVLAYRAGWKTQESIAVKTYKLLGGMTDFLVGRKDKYVLPNEL
jgi:lactate dehydrogenase-like 2-hydroxyacid dehydrogenase